MNNYKSRTLRPDLESRLRHLVLEDKNLTARSSSSISAGCPTVDP